MDDQGGDRPRGCPSGRRGEGASVARGIFLGSRGDARYPGLTDRRDGKDDGKGRSDQSDSGRRLCGGRWRAGPMQRNGSGGGAQSPCRRRRRARRPVRVTGTRGPFRRTIRRKNGKCVRNGRTRENAPSPSTRDQGHQRVHPAGGQAKRRRDGTRRGIGAVRMILTRGPSSWARREGSSNAVMWWRRPRSATEPPHEGGPLHPDRG